jgi:hypothetical protein
MAGSLAQSNSAPVLALRAVPAASRLDTKIAQARQVGWREWALSVTRLPYEWSEGFIASLSGTGDETIIYLSAQDWESLGRWLDAHYGFGKWPGEHNKRQIVHAGARWQQTDNWPPGWACVARKVGE